MFHDLFYFPIYGFSWRKPLWEIRKRKSRDFGCFTKDIVVKTGVQPDKIERHVRWAEKFANSTEGKSLRLRDRQEVEIFLADLRAKGSPGQVGQKA